MNSNNLENYYNKKNISLPCIILCAIFVLITAILSLLPSSLSQTFRPIFIIICFLCSQNYRYKCGAEKWQLILVAYLGILLLVNPITNTAIVTYISILLFGLFFVAASTRVWSKREIKFLLYSITVATFALSAIVLISNPNLITIGADKINFLSYTLNRNTFGFGMVPGTLCLEILLLYSNRRKGKKVLGTIVLMLYVYTIIALSCRSAAISAFLGSILIYWNYTSEHYEIRKRRKKRFGFLMFLVIAVIVLYLALQNTTGSRLFDLNNDTGRAILREAAMELVAEKPVFGGGFDCWTDSGQTLATHNTFLTYMVASGYVGGALLALFIISMVLECFKARNLISLAFLVELVCHTLTESGMDYYAYIPMVLAYIILRYTQNSSHDIGEIFNEQS